MVKALKRCSLIGAGLALAGSTTSPSPAQTLLDVMGAGAIQNTLQSLPAGGASGAIERSRGAVDQAGQAEQQRLDALQQLGGGAAAPGAGAAALMLPSGVPTQAPGAASAARAAVPATALVNGRLVPYCSHGGLCQGSLLRALRRD